MARFWFVLAYLCLYLSTAAQLDPYLARARAARNASTDTLCKYARLADALSPNNTTALFYCAECLLQSGQLDSAYASLSRLPGGGAIGQARVTALIRLERYTEASEVALHYLNVSVDTLDMIAFKNLLGAVNMKLLHKAEALKWYRDGVSTSSDSGFYRAYPFLYGNLGILYATMGKWDSAETYTTLAIRFERDSDNLVGLAGVLPALGALYMETGRQALAGPAFAESLNDAKSLGDPYLVIAALISNATYQRASAHYAPSIALCRSALELVERYRIRSQLGFIYQTLEEDYKGLGDYKNYASALEAYTSLKDSVNRANSEAALQDLRVKYEVQQKENTILRQNLELGRKNVWIISGFILSACIVGFALVLFRLNRHRQRIQTALSVKDAEDKERRRVAAELHDDMGTRITILSHSASKLMEVSPDLGQQIQEASHDLMQSLRETVWALKQETIQSSDVWVRYKNFLSKLHQAYPGVRLDVREGGGFLEKPLTYNEALNVIRVLQEATANALKHSGCTRLVCEVSGLGEALVFRITDNGKGFVSVGAAEGNGIPNMQERARESGFDLRINSEVGRGTSVELRLH